MTADVHANVSSRSSLRFHFSSFSRPSTWNVNTGVPPLLTNILFQVETKMKVKNINSAAGTGGFGFMEQVHFISATQSRDGPKITD